MIQMAFNIIGIALYKKNNVTLLAKKEEKSWWYDFAFGFGGRKGLVFMEGRHYYKDFIQQLETEFLPHGPDYAGRKLDMSTRRIFCS